MKERRYYDSAEIISAEKVAEDAIKANRRNIIRGIFYGIVCLICLFILK